jgi:hypothetical protein
MKHWTRAESVGEKEELGDSPGPGSMPHGTESREPPHSGQFDCDFNATGEEMAASQMPAENIALMIQSEPAFSKLRRAAM